MRILHITDLHYSKNSTGWDFTNLFNALIENISKENEEKKIDLIFITGDLIDKGGNSFHPHDPYQIVEKEILNRLAKTLNLTNDKIIIIPGNHDVKEKKGASLFFLKGLRNEEIDIPAINRLIEENLASISEEEITGLADFKQFEKHFYSKSLDKNTEILSSEFETAFVLQFGKAKIGVAAFNSAWSCSTVLDQEGKYKLAFGSSQILRASKFFQERNTDFNIALLHHPIKQGFFTEEEENEMMTAFSKGNFSLLFFGHTHKAKDEYIIDAEAGYYLVVTKSCFNPRERIEPYKSGFSIIDLSYLNEEEINVCRHFRKYIQNKRFDFDVEEAIQGKSVKKIRPSKIGPEFISYLKSWNNVAFDPNRKVLFEQINSISQSYWKSPFPEIADQALKTIISRFLTDCAEFNSYRENLKIKWELYPIDSDHYYLRESQSYTFITTSEKLLYKYSLYIDILLDGKDKSNLKIEEYKIDGIDFSSEVIESTELLPKSEIYGKERKWYKLQIELGGKKSYAIESKFEAINCLKTKLAWINNPQRIVEGYEFTISDPTGSFHIELFNISKNTCYSNRGSNGQRQKEIIIKRPKEVLIPSDEIWLFVSSS